LTARRYGSGTTVICRRENSARSPPLPR
jgi:hypothetical protein